MSATAMVFAPVPLLTVVVERPTDESELHIHAGGQGVWQARMMTALDVAVTMCACLGGETGDIVEQLIRREGIELRVVPSAGPAGWYVHDRRGGERELIAKHPGPQLDRHEIDELFGLALSEGLRSDVSLLSGPADPTVVAADVYRRLAADLTTHAARVVADLSGDYLGAALAGGVHVLKVSHEELIKDGWADDDCDDAVVSAMHRLREEGAENVIVSRADRPALALIDGEPVQVAVGRLEPRDHRGAGDSMTAGVAAVLARGGDLREAIRTGAAAGAFNVTRHGLGSGRLDAIAELTQKVQIRRLGER